MNVDTRSLSKVVQSKADIGFAFDGDGDGLFVDEKGKRLMEIKLLLFFVKILLNPK